MLEKQLEKCSETNALRDVQRASRDVRRNVLRCAELCVCTLSAAGGDLANLMVTIQQRSRGTCTDSELRFDAVIIDEAAQAIEPAALIPLHALNPMKVCAGARVHQDDILSFL
jgi:superfamily I DNA and/or RNA helicase